MTTGNGVPAQAPLYARVLRLRQLRVGGFLSFLLFECMIALGVLLALAELVSWWAIPILPAAVAVMVKVNDVVAGPRNRRRERESARAGASRGGPAAGLDDEQPAVVAGAGRPVERARAAGGRGGSGSPGQGRPSQQAGSRERLDSAEDGSKSGDGTQRRPIGVIRIAVPPRDGGAGRAATTAAQRGPATATAQSREAAERGVAAASRQTQDSGAGRGVAAATTGAEREVAARTRPHDGDATTGAGGQRGAGEPGSPAAAETGPVGGRSGTSARTPNGGALGETSGRHARVQRSGGRYSDDGYVSNGRHSDSIRRGDEELTRQRGTLNQGRFA